MSLEDGKGGMVLVLKRCQASLIFVCGAYSIGQKVKFIATKFVVEGSKNFRQWDCILVYVLITLDTVL